MVCKPLREPYLTCSIEFMKRSEFLRISGILGLGIPFASMLTSCKKDITRPDHVLIIGAGAAGITAGHLLKQLGIDFTILEASSQFGGRMITSDSFADFPIPLGAEWLSTRERVFQDIVNDSAVSVEVETVGYSRSDSYAIWQNGTLSYSTLGGFSDRKFVNSSWLDFFETYLLPSVSAQIKYDAVVESIDYSGDGVELKTEDMSYFGDKVIVTVPLKILQLDQISFNPALPAAKQDAIHHAEVWGGLKVMLEFSEKFYPVWTDIEAASNNDGDRSYYDAAYGQNSSRNILGLFSVGARSDVYTGLSDSDLIEFVLDELDEVFAGQARPAYQQHLIQNWTTSPFARGAYLGLDGRARELAVLAEPVDEKVYFAGDAYTTRGDWGFVHVAAQAASDAVELIVA